MRWQSKLSVVVQDPDVGPAVGAEVGNQPGADMQPYEERTTKLVSLERTHCLACCKLQGALRDQYSVRRSARSIRCSD